MPLLSMCVCDSNEIVRKHTITLLTKLLSEDYIKWKGLLFFRFLMALVDPSPAVQVFGTPLLLALGWVGGCAKPLGCSLWSFVSFPCTVQWWLWWSLVSRSDPDWISAR